MNKTDVQSSPLNYSGLSPGQTPDDPSTGIPILTLLERWAWLPIPLFMLASFVLWLVGDTGVFEPPYLLAILNFIFSTAVMLLIAYLAARSYIMSPSQPVLFLGCGGLCFGTVSLLGAIAIHFGQINLALTIYNTGVLLSGLGMVLSSVGERSNSTNSHRYAGLRVNLFYGLVLTIIGLLAFTVWKNLTPSFFIQGQGGTPLRQVVLGCAVGAFAVAGLIVHRSARGCTRVFSIWYSSGLGLIATGLFAVLISNYVGSPLGWLGRTAQYLGGIYIFGAILHIIRHNRHGVLSLQEALQRSEERFRLAVSATGLGAYSYNYLTGVKEYSPEFLTIYGLSIEEKPSVHEDLPSAIYHDDRPHVFAELHARRKKEIPADFSCEHRIVRPDGEVRWIQDTGRMHFSGSDEPIGVHGIIQDITERKKAEEDLRTSEERYSLAIKNSSFVPSQFDRNLRYQWIHNPHPDFDPSHLLEKRDDEIDDSEAARRLVDLKRRVVEDGVKVREEIDFRLSDGVRTYDFTLEPLYDDNTKIVGGTSCAFDITDRKRAEEKISRSEQHLRDVLDNLVALVGVLTPDGILLEANHTALDLGRLHADDVVGKPFDKTYWWSWSPEAQKQLREAITTAAAGEPSRYDAVIRVAEGRMKTIDFMLAPLIDEQGRVKYLIPSAIDITDRKHVEEERERLIADLEAANQELEGFTYSVSHDLRAPLRHMSSFAQLLKEDSWTVLGEQGRSYLTTVLNASNRMAMLADELLEFSRMGRIELNETLVDLDLIVEETIRSIPIDTERRDIQWRISRLPMVWGDAAMLQLVFLNLIDNAIKFSRGRCPAVLEIGHHETLKEHVIYVRDNGIGFDMQYYDKLFGIFQRLHKAEGIDGTGIGLANVARIVQRHGGRVWAEGKVNEGAVFYVALAKVTRVQEE